MKLPLTIGLIFLSALYLFSCKSQQATTVDGMTATFKGINCSTEAWVFEDTRGEISAYQPSQTLTSEEQRMKSQLKEGKQYELNMTRKPADFGPANRAQCLVPDAYEIAYYISLTSMKSVDQ
ncbi:MAG: hypothetical protein AAF135_20195 [Bacteroidota bacterium]